jgi:hypothetical protein
MEKQNNFKLNRLTINHLDLLASSPKVSDHLFPLVNESGIINDFFITHLLETREGKSTKSCKFIDDDASVKIKIDRYKQNISDEGFLQLSKELTENLFTIMKSSSSNSSGTFFVLDVVLSGEQCIFFIKLDPKTGVQVDYENLTVRALENILPDSNDRVHKCSIIRFNKPINGEEAELYVMDKQQKEGEAARFFIETFLQAQELLNDKIITKEVIRSARANLVNIVPEVDPNRIYEHIDRQFSNNSRIELRTAIKNILEDSVPAEKQDRELFIKNSADQFVTEYIKKHPDHQTTFLAERNDNTIVYKGEKNQIFFRYNNGLLDKIQVTKDKEKNTVITIDKTVRLERELK